ncbi:hypothetical protein [Desulfovibrio sp. UIB00]|uniref:hypothetical protein n=1 Tax=Desulfovibrio sp. UIB00 TaxID=2804314 RepID=UPI001F0E8500|nr:hypothetical protein [Desulfovibrio sp. UIB00]
MQQIQEPHARRTPGPRSGFFTRSTPSFFLFKKYFPFFSMAQNFISHSLCPSHTGKINHKKGDCAQWNYYQFQRNFNTIFIFVLLHFLRNHHELAIVQKITFQHGVVIEFHNVAQCISAFLHNLFV